MSQIFAGKKKIRRECFASPPSYVGNNTLVANCSQQFQHMRVGTFENTDTSGDLWLMQKQNTVGRET